MNNFIKKLISIKIPALVLVFLFLLSLTALFLLFRANPKLIGVSSNIVVVTPPADELKKILEDVGLLILLPSDETPQLATVTDTETLKNQPFFSKAEKGDKMLIYQSSKKAILYRPSIKKIVEVGSVNVSSPSSQITNNPSSSRLNRDSSGQATINPSTTSIPSKQSLSFLLLNGTNTIGLTKKYEIELKQKIPDAIIVDRDNARKKDYEKTIIVDLTGNKKGVAESLAKTLQIQFDTLPAGESATSAADFLIILGKDKT